MPTGNLNEPQLSFFGELDAQLLAAPQPSTRRAPRPDSKVGRDNPRVPAAWLTTPIFTLASSTRPVEPTKLVIDGNTWLFNVPNPLTGEPSRRLTVDHAGVLFSILGMFSEQQALVPTAQDKPVCLDISFTDILTRVAYCDEAEDADPLAVKNGKRIRGLRTLIDDLRNIYFSFVETIHDGGEQKRIVTTFALLHGNGVRRIYSLKRNGDLDGNAPVEYFEKPIATWLDKVVIHPIMARFALGLVRIVTFKLGSFRALRSDIARAIYLFIPSRAYSRTAENPWSIALPKLLWQIGHHGISFDPATGDYKATIPSLAAASLRKQLFTKNGTAYEDTSIDGRLDRSLLAQLDGARMSGGRFRCRIEQNAAGSEWLFVCWREADITPKTKPHALRHYEDAEPTKLEAAWRAADRPIETFHERLAKLPDFTSYEAESFEEASIDLRTSRTFFLQAKALLGTTHFDSLLREAVQQQQGFDQAPSNPTGLLISRIIAAIRPLEEIVIPQVPEPKPVRQRDQAPAVKTPPTPATINLTASTGNDDADPMEAWKTLSDEQRAKVLAYARHWGLNSERDLLDHMGLAGFIRNALA